VVREGEGGAAEVGEGEVECVLELGLGVGRSGVCGSRERGCGVPAGVAERVQVEDLSVLAREFALCEVALIECPVGSGVAGI
jgi:hypothetical protein